MFDRLLVRFLCFSVYRFVFFVSLFLTIQKLKFFCVPQASPTSLLLGLAVIFFSLEEKTKVDVVLMRFVFPPRLLRFLFTSICICMHFFFSVFCFFTTCSLFFMNRHFMQRRWKKTLKLRFLSPKSFNFYESKLFGDKNHSFSVFFHLLCIQ